MLNDFLGRAREYFRAKLGMTPNYQFDFDAHSLDPTEAERLFQEAETDFDRLVYSNKGQVVHKWVHYLGVYDKHLSRFRQTNFKMLEIGVYKGGSLDLWRKYFGESATIFGIDINPECANFANPPNQVRIGSQADPNFLTRVIDEMGEPDVILDDGSHVARHQLASFKALWPKLRMGGIYIIEDLHTSYWPGSYGGGYRRKSTAVGLVKAVIDDMHGWYHNKGAEFVDPAEIQSIHVYDSMVLIEKGPKKRPVHIKVGQGAEALRYRY